LRHRLRVQSFLLEYDFGVSAEIAEVHPGFDRQLGERKVEVIGDRAHDGVALAHERQDRLTSADVYACREQSRSGERREKWREVIDGQVREPDLANIRILK